MNLHWRACLIPGLVAICGAACAVSPQLGRGPVGPAVEVDAESTHEVCLTLRADDAVRYAYASDAAVAFDVHSHEGERVVYAVRDHTSTQRDDRFLPDRAGRYCLAWRNPHPGPVTLRYSASIEPR